MSLRFSPAVEKALAEVCPPVDAIDKPDFDPIAYLNMQFPDEASLTSLGAFHEDITTRLRHTENDLLKAVEAQAVNGSAADKDLRDAKAAVSGLYNRVSDIRKTTAHSEDTVRELCQNIRQLDIAKTNLTTSINTLRSMQLWMGQLQTLASSFEKREYTKCRDALIEAQKYAAQFDKMKDMPKVKELLDKQQQITKQMEYYIRNSVFGDMKLDGADKSVLAEACAVVDVLGKEAFKKIRDKFIDLQMQTYMDRFKRGSEDAKLDRTERRYSFIRQLLKNLEPIFQNVFPRPWCVPQELCVSFCLRTKTELDVLLSEAAGAIDVTVLMIVLQKTIDVERDLTQMMAWKEDFPGQDQLPVYKYNGLILSSFKAHMGLFVQSEDRSMKDLLSEPFKPSDFGEVPTSTVGATVGAIAAARLGGMEEDTRCVGMTLPASQDIFLFIKESCNRTVRIAQQDVLVDMAGVWRENLVRFCDLVCKELRTPAATPADICRACIIVNTAEYCQTTSQALGDEVCSRSGVPSAELKFEEVSIVFSTLYTKGIHAVVQGVEKNITSYLNEISSGKFMNLRTSAYVDQEMEAQDETSTIRGIRAVLQDATLGCAAILSTNVLRFLLDKLAVSIIQLYSNCLYRMRRISDVSIINQFRVDSGSLEKTFLQLPNFNDPERYATSALSGYMKLVRNGFNRLNRALKVLQVDCSGNDDVFVDVYYEVTLPEDRSIEHFVRIVELKGLRREDVRPWITKLSKLGVVERTNRDMERETALNAAAGTAAAGGTGAAGGGINMNFGFASNVAGGMAAVFGSPTTGGGNGGSAFSAPFSSLIGGGGGSGQGNNGPAHSNATNVNAAAAARVPGASAGAGANGPRLHNGEDEGQSLGSRFAKAAQRTVTSMNFLNQLKKE